MTRRDIHVQIYRATRFNAPRNFGELRRIYRAAEAGVKFGMCAGYLP